LERNHLDGKFALDLGRSREKSFHRLGQALACTRGACDEQRGDSLADELAIKNDERDAPKVVAMQVRQDNCTDVVWVYSEPPHRNEGSCPAINQNLRALSVQKNARLQPPAATKGIAASEELDPHTDSLSQSHLRVDAARETRAFRASRSSKTEGSEGNQPR